MRFLAFLFFVAAIGYGAYTFRENESLKKANAELSQQIAELRSREDDSSTKEFVPATNSLSSPNVGTVASPASSGKRASWMWNPKESKSSLENHKK